MQNTLLSQASEAIYAGNPKVVIVEKGEVCTGFPESRGTGPQLDH